MQNQRLPSITVTCREAHEAICQVILVHETAKLAAHMRSIDHRLIPVSDNCLCDQSSEIIIVLPANTFHGNSDIGSWDSIVTDSHLRADESRLFLLGSGVYSGITG